MVILYAVLVLGVIGAVGAVSLSSIARKFHVDEDERIGQLEELLPGANCGACGLKGCHDFAVQCVAAGNLDGFYCPVSGQQGMMRVAEFMGCNASVRQPEIAVVKCAGTSETKTALRAHYVGPKVCAVMNMTAGDYECAESCLGCGDCTEVCNFSAIKIFPGLDRPVVDADRCTGCGACVTNCPRHIIELRPKGIKGRRVWVACSNCQKGAITRRQCKVGCIACGICVKTCPFGAITIKDNHAYIDPVLCKTCGKCVPVCPTHAIKSNNIVIKQNHETSDI